MNLAKREEWRDIPGYGNHYQASSFGRIRVKDRIIEKRTRHGGVMRQLYRERILPPTRSDKWGHLSLHLGVNGQKFSVAVHTLVLLAFVGPRPHGMEACHGNGNAADNCPENLRWDTHHSNNQDRKRHGRYATGEEHHAFKYGPEIGAAIKDGSIGLLKAMSLHGISRTHYYRLRNR